MDFAVLSPEVNSGRLYAGPGSGPMLAAAAAWGRLAGELGSAARGYESVVAGLTGEGWLGPAAQAMAVAAGRFAGWLSLTGVRAEQTAVQARAAAAAFEEAYAAAVPPAVIVANRSQLTSLVATNVLGQHAAAIAAVEAQYGEMWLHDAAVMYGYAGRSAAAAAVPGFDAAPQTTSAAGPAGQTAAVGHAGAGAAQTQLSKLMAEIPQALHGSSPGGSPAAPLDQLSPLQSTGTPSASQAASYLGLMARSVLPANDTNVSILDGQVQYARNLNIAADIAKAKAAGPPGLKAVIGPAAPAAPAASAVSAVVGDAGLVGKLAVPPGWVPAAPEVTMTASALPATAATAAPAAGAGIRTDLFADTAVAGLAGRAIGGSAARKRSAKARDQGRLERLAGELTGSREVQHWRTDPGQRKSLLKELSQQPGVHTVHTVHPEPDHRPEPGARPEPG